MIYLTQLTCAKQRKSLFNGHKYKNLWFFLTYFAYKTKSCQNQNLCFKSFNSHSYKVYRKVLQSILASSTTNWGTLVQISWCWVIFRYSFLSMKQLRIILHTLLNVGQRHPHLHKESLNKDLKICLFMSSSFLHLHVHLQAFLVADMQLYKRLCP